MPTVKVTKRTVDAVEAGSRDLFLWDTEVAGFGCKITPKGARSYVVQYRMGGRETNSIRHKIGRHGTWTPDAARDEARRLLRMVDQGIDPREADRERRREAVELAFRSYSTLFEEKFLKPTWKDWVNAKRHLDLHCVPVLGDRPLTKITRQHVSGLLDRLSDRPATQKNVYATLRKLFNWAVNRGDIGASPLAGMTPPSGVKARARVLNREELVSVWLAADELGTRHGTVVKLLILNGQRLVEDAAMEWGELDLGKRQWLLPPERTKNKLPHIVPLGPQSVALIQAQPKAASPFVLAGPRGKYPKGWADAKVKLDEAALRILRKRAAERGESPDEVKLPQWQLHDLRRTLATGMPELGISAEIVEAVLNHISGVKAGVAGVYNRYQYLPEKTAALLKWDEHVQALIAAPNTPVEASN